MAGYLTHKGNNQKNRKGIKNNVGLQRQGIDGSIIYTRFRYLNTVKTYGVRAEKSDGTEDGPDEYPGIPDNEDDANTPVQEPSNYPFIWLLKGDAEQKGT